MHPSPLPIVLSYPHGGLDIPPELDGLLVIGQQDIYNECDLWVDRLFDFGPSDQTQGDASAAPRGAPVLACVSMSIARALVDANRDPDDLTNPDGAVKALTSYGRPVYRNEPSTAFKRELVERYWRPFDLELRSTLDQHTAAAKLYLDCHNMAQLGPSTYGDPGASRPFICLANLGDHRGERRPGGERTSCKGAFIRRAAEIASDLFADLELLEPGPTAAPIVAINQPYAGGHILRWFTQEIASGAGLPGMMIEINRGLFVGNQDQNTPVAPPNQERIAAIRSRLHTWLVRVLEELA